MKKLVAVVMIITVTMLTGCGMESLLENNFPASLEGEYISINNEANVALLNSNIKDAAMFNGEMHLVAYSAKRQVPSEAIFLYYDEDAGRVYPLQAVKIELAYKNAEEYPEMLASVITLNVLDLLGESQCGRGDVVGVIMNWEKPRLFGGSTRRSVCDLDGDGMWDYCAKEDHSIYYTSPTSSSLAVAEDSQPRRIFDDYNIVGIKAEGGIDDFNEDYLN